MPEDAKWFNAFEDNTECFAAMMLEQAGVPCAAAKQLTFSSKRELVRTIESIVTSEQAEAYGMPKLHSWSMMKRGATPEMAQTYHGWEPDDIVDLFAENIEACLADSYMQEWTTPGIDEHVGASRGIDLHVMRNALKAGLITGTAQAILERLRLIPNYTTTFNYACSIRGLIGATAQTLLSKAGYIVAHNEGYAPAGTPDVFRADQARPSPLLTTAFRALHRLTDDMTRHHFTGFPGRHSAEPWDVEDIIALVKADVPAPAAQAYRYQDWTGAEAAILYKAGLGVNECQLFPDDFNAAEIVALWNMGFRGGEIPTYGYSRRLNRGERKSAAFDGGMPAVSHSLQNFVRAAAADHDDMRLIDTGRCGIVLRVDHHAWKFTDDARTEYDLLEKVEAYHKGRQQNVIRVLDTSHGDGIIEMEYIEGESLESMLQDHATLPAGDVLKYGADIINGLVELREAGIMHHRDIKPKNILIDRARKRAVIIDLGVSTTQMHPEPQPEYNKTYGTHDILAVGQLMYRMIVGSHLFKGDPSLFTDDQKVAIRDARQKAIEGTIDEHKATVAAHVKDERVRDVVTHCLDTDDLYRIKALMDGYVSDHRTPLSRAATYALDSMRTLLRPTIS